MPHLALIVSKKDTTLTVRMTSKSNAIYLSIKTLSKNYNQAIP